MVNSRQLSKQMTQPAITVIQYSDGKWKVKDKERYCLFYDSTSCDHLIMLILI